MEVDDVSESKIGTLSAPIFYDVFACELYKQIKTRKFLFGGNFSTQQDDRDGGGGKGS